MDQVPVIGIDLAVTAASELAVASGAAIEAGRKVAATPKGLTEGIRQAAKGRAVAIVVESTAMAWLVAAVAALRCPSPCSGALRSVLPPRARCVCTPRARCVRQRVAPGCSGERPPEDAGTQSAVEVLSACGSPCRVVLPSCYQKPSCSCVTYKLQSKNGSERATAQRIHRPNRQQSLR